MREASGARRAKNSLLNSSQWRRAAWCEMVAGNFEAEAEVIVGLFVPAGDNLRLW
ncbi:hypothetical protein [Klebsiella pneumoniae IS46]|nr:hypothetical protein [Klebsiella pneumoniae IS46]